MQSHRSPSATIMRDSQRSSSRWSMNSRPAAPATPSKASDEESKTAVKVGKFVASLCIYRRIKTDRTVSQLFAYDHHSNHLTPATISFLSDFALPPAKSLHLQILPYNQTKAGNSSYLIAYLEKMWINREFGIMSRTASHPLFRATMFPFSHTASREQASRTPWELQDLENSRIHQ